MIRILWVATKPAWPPVDGGRLAMWQTMKALAAGGHRVTFVSPIDGSDSDPAAAEAALRAVCTPALVPSPRPSSLRVALRSLFERQPVSIARHRSDEVRDRVDALIAHEPFDVVHAEQLQALAQCEGAARHGIPIVLRAQNVESDLWRPVLRWEARRLRAWEAAAVRRVSATIALTATDALRLREISGSGETVHHVPVPFPPELPSGPALPGSPALVVMGSGGWRPNREGTRWLVSRVWPALRQALPEARLHVCHPPPAESVEAFAEGAILLVPLHVASGVRIKILEAWARGLPVVATSAAARGLGDEPPVLLADTPSDFVAAVRRLHEDRDLRRALVDRGRRRLREEHDPGQIASRLADVYQRAPRMGAASVRSTIERSTAGE